MSDADVPGKFTCQAVPRLLNLGRMPPRIVALALIATLLTPGVLAAEPKSPAKAKKSAKKAPSLEQFAEHVLKKGGSTKLQVEIVQDLGFKSEQSIRDMYVDVKTKAGDITYIILVVPDTAAKPQKARDLIWERVYTVRSDKKDDKEKFDSWFFRSDLSGALAAAAYADGINGNLVQKAMPLDERTKTIFEETKAALLGSGLGNLKVEKE